MEAVVSRGVGWSSVVASVVALLGVPDGAWAFSIGTSVSQRCHEKITGKAIARSNVDKPEGWIRSWPQQDASWLKVARWLEEEGLIEPKDDDRWRLLQVSMFLGARYPDQRGFGLTDLQGLREIHLSGNDQSAHALRAPDQDGQDGDRLALESARALIRELVAGARSAVDPWSMAGHMRAVSVWVEFYGDVDVVVWEPAFSMAKALHALQDSFAHTYRSPDLGRVYAVCNFVEAIAGKYDERRDGPRHSVYTDDCDQPDVEPLKEAAVLASTDLFNAGLVYMQSGDMRAVDDVLDRWLTLEPGCGFDAGYCDTPWAAVARRNETHAFGCSHASTGSPGIGVVIVVLGMLVSVKLARGTRTPRPARSVRAQNAKIRARMPRHTPCHVLPTRHASVSASVVHSGRLGLVGLQLHGSCRVASSRRPRDRRQRIA